MRVITGTARGRKLKELAGLETRPTTDRVKEGIFNIIQFDIEGRTILDLFAGTGQLGIEALSRGASRAVFVDARRNAISLINENLKLTNLSEHAEAICGDAFAFLKTTQKKFDIIFIDPPYGAELWEKALNEIYRFDILARHGIIICEAPVTRPMPELSPPYLRHRTYRYGKIQVTTYHKEAEE